jgi:hypothetical protein
MGITADSAIAITGALDGSVHMVNLSSGQVKFCISLINLQTLSVGPFQKVIKCQIFYSPLLPIGPSFSSLYKQ